MYIADDVISNEKDERNATIFFAPSAKTAYLKFNEARNSRIICMNVPAHNNRGSLYHMHNTRKTNGQCLSCVFSSARRCHVETVTQQML
jgi:hypothetical protein